MRVLFLTAEYPQSAKAVADSLMNRFPDDFLIDTMDVGYYYQRSAPNVDSLLAKKYRCIWTWANYSYMNSVACGESLAHYLDRNGGGAIISPFEFYDMGRFTTVYTPCNYPYGTSGSSTLGTVQLPGHKIMENVNSINVQYYGGSVNTLSHTTAYKVCDFANNYILAACNDTAGRHIAVVDFYPVGVTYGYYSGDVLRLMRNAIMWAGQNDDVGVSSLLAPTGIVDSGSTIVPACSTHNFGNQVETYKVRMKIGATYNESTLVTSQTPGAYNYVTFPTWTATARGNAAVACSTMLAIDSRTANDKQTATVFVRVVDVSPTAMAVPLPGGSYKYDTVITPKATWHNYGNVTAANVEAWMLLSNSTDARVYSKKVTIPSLAVGGSIQIGSFPACTLHANGTWVSECSTFLAGDVNPGNDTMVRGFTVTGGPVPPPPTAWTAKSPMPAGAKYIQAGGWLAYDAAGSDAGTGRIYASRGNKQADFFSYNPANDSWKALAPWLPGTEAKLPGAGSAGCADGNGVVYATKGNNKSGFYKYDAVANTWAQKKDVPLGLSNKKLKGGTGIAWAYKGSTGSAYLLKGYKNEFYKYIVDGDSWATLTPAPVGANQKWDKGSWLASDGAHTIYAFKAKYMELYGYNTETDSWSVALAPMPAAGSAGSKKAKDGSCGAYVAGSIKSVFALKGGNTREFWKYTIATNAWAEKETIPTGTMKKKVKTGAGISAAGLSLYATKGNKSNELWLYVPTGLLFEAPPQHDGVLAGKTVTAQGMSISPNPLATGFAVLRYGLPKAGAAELSVYNVAGQTVMLQTLVAGSNGTVNLDLRHLSNGVYLVKLSSEGYVNSQKLVVQR